MSGGTVRFERRGAVGWVTFDRPEARNAFTYAMYDSLVARLREADADPSLGALVLTGAGAAFAAGTDIALFVGFRTAEEAVDYESRLDAVLEVIERLRLPTIAAVRGPCTGSGLAIAACCDLRIAAPSARFGMPIARTLGNCLTVANLVRVAAIIGQARTVELIMTGRLIGPDEGRSAGIVGEVTSEESLDARALELGVAVASLAPLTLRATKEGFRRIRAAARAEEGRDLVELCYTSEDFREGVRAFLDKRAPLWRGR